MILPGKARAASMKSLAGASRFVKIVGLRVDLGRVERLLADLGLSAAAAGSDETVGCRWKGTKTSPWLPKHWLRTWVCRAPPSKFILYLLFRGLPMGSPTIPASWHCLASRVQICNRRPRHERVQRHRRTQRRGIFADVLECQNVKYCDTFVSLAGDSCSPTRLLRYAWSALSGMFRPDGTLCVFASSRPPLLPKIARPAR